MIPLAGLVLAAATAGGAVAPVDGNAALRHASALASLGPHPWGSPRARAAAAYVAAQLRGAGLSEVRQEDFEVKGLHGVNVVAVLKGPSPTRIPCARAGPSSLRAGWSHPRSPAHAERAPRWASAIPGSRGCTSPPCARSASTTTATTSPSCRRECPRCSCPTRR